MRVRAVARSGLAPMDTALETGTLTTKPFRCERGRLSINAAARGGLVGVAVLDKHGIQYDGFSRAACALFDGDSVKHNVTWRDKGSLDEPDGRNICLKFYLRNARLYSFAVR